MDREDEDDDVQDGEQYEEAQEEIEQPRHLPADLPRTLDDRQNFRSWNEDTEYYDVWQGQSHVMSAPTTAKPLSFNLSLHEPDDSGAFDSDFGNDDARIVQMLASSARRGEDDSGETEEEEILDDEQLSRDQKIQALQDFLFMAASNGDAQRVTRLVRGRASDLVDFNAVDAEGTPPLVYCACFGNFDVALALLDAGAIVDIQDRNQWTALMWAVTNRHKDIAKVLLDHGASLDIKSSSGRTALDFVPSNSEMSNFLQHGGYSIGSVGISDDYYSSGLSQDRFEEELAEGEMRRRMMMESAINLEVDLGNLGLDEQLEPTDDAEEGQEFVWDRCLNDQMFVFMENDISRILNVVITNMTPQRTPSQKPVPANIVFLGARYAQYHANKELLAEWLESAQEMIYAVVDRHQWDMTILAFWMSNTTLLLYYLKKDTGLAQETAHFQAQMAELIHEIYILIIRDAERRMDKVLDSAMLDHETIPGFEDIHFQNEWSFLRSKSKVKPEPADKRFRPPSPKRKAQISPRNVTSLLSSALFVLDLYDVHSIIVTQILSQLYYWLDAEIFNRIMSNKRYLARTKAMQIRMNVSMLEDWARANNRQPEHKQNGSTSIGGEATIDTARRHLAPLVQLLQWLQCFSSLGEDKQALETTLQQLPNLSIKQLLHATKHYRAEVGEKTLNRASLKYIQEIKSRPKLNARAQSDTSATAAAQASASSLDPSQPYNNAAGRPSTATSQGQLPPQPDEDNDMPDDNLMNPGAASTFPPAHLNGHAYLISKPLGSRILSFSDEWFASAENLTTPTPPIRKPGVFTYAGAWYDGWETRRHNPEPFDWVVIRLGVSSGRVRGVEIDTAFFNGNQAPEIAVQGCNVTDEKEDKVKSSEFQGWETILSSQECGPSQRHGWLLGQETENTYTHVRLQMFPDGGIARFRLYGTVVPVLPQDINAVFDLAATVNGGVAVACSDQHFGTKDNLLLPGRGVDMGDGWETKRSRGEHVDYVIVRLGAHGQIERLVIDTAHFRGNFPQKAQVFAALPQPAGQAPAHGSKTWVEILPELKLGADKEHEFGQDVLRNVDEVYGFVKMVIIPDGGVKRLRVFGRRNRAGP